MEQPDRSDGERRHRHHHHRHREGGESSSSRRSHESREYDPNAPSESSSRRSHRHRDGSSRSGENYEGSSSSSRRREETQPSSSSSVSLMPRSSGQSQPQPPAVSSVPTTSSAAPIYSNTEAFADDDGGESSGSWADAAAPYVVHNRSSSRADVSDELNKLSRTFNVKVDEVSPNLTVSPDESLQLINEQIAQLNKLLKIRPEDQVKRVEVVEVATPILSMMGALIERLQRDLAVEADNVERTKAQSLSQREESTRRIIKGMKTVLRQGLAEIGDMETGRSVTQTSIDRSR